MSREYRHIYTLAVPIRNRRGRCIAALNICGHSSQTSLENLKSKHLGDALDVVRKLESAIP
ncbi:MAG: hypothetical protein GY789_05335 [Hyphomicrobiales bacterium]|nr:hypothetical protein [Hyphomicrobiales bacterium]MCP5001507.1 hypothetical protein [Hyphomicrobiales bacterium]